MRHVAVALGIAAVLMVVLVLSETRLNRNEPPLPTWDAIVRGVR
jgi:hypothetical protein